MVTEDQIREAKKLLGRRTIIVWHLGRMCCIYGQDAWKAGEVLRCAVLTDEHNRAAMQFSARELDAARADLAEAGFRVAVLQSVHP